MKPVSSLLSRASASMLAAPCLLAGAGQAWEDTFYQYRLPVEFSVEKPGWHVLPIDEAAIAGAVNELEELKYRDRSFAHNYVKCVEIDAAGRPVATAVDAGFYLVETGPDRAAGWSMAEPSTDAEPMFEEHGIAPPTRKGDELNVDVDPGEFFLLRYTTGGGGSPLLKYEPIFPEGSKLNKHMTRVSYEPRLLPLAEATHEVLIQPQIEMMTLLVGGRFINTPKDLSLRQCRILFLANITTPGTKRYMLYYQPMCTHHLMLPERRHETVPDPVAELRGFGPAEKYEGRTRQLLGEHRHAALWFAETTVKLTPATPPPLTRDPVIRVSCARNERQSFQVVVTPRRAVHVGAVRVTDLVNGPARIGSDRIAIKQVEYVPVRISSDISPTDYRGWIGDPLTVPEPGLLTPEVGNRGFWITIDVAADSGPGTYSGTIRVEGEAAGEPLFEASLELTVHHFALPEYSPLQAHFGGQYFVKPGVFPNDERPRRRMIDHYGVTSREDLQTLTKAVYTEMVRNKFTPKNAALYTPIGMKWEPPPEGLNVDKPGNFFRLYDWDFTEFNEQMRYFIDELKMNQICIYHTNPVALNIFMHLPGEELSEYPASSPFVCYAWQSFRDATFVGYDIHEKHSYRKLAQDITREQYDRLVLDFFRAIAANLDEHGWLRFATIMVDETHHDRFLMHFLKLLKSDPLTARIKTGTCVQGLTYFTDPKFNGLLDYYIPQLDENYNRWEPHYFTDYGIEPERSKLWNYVVHGTRFVIDAPGINNREIGLDLWKRGASGYVCWETLLHSHTRGDWQDRQVDNVWLEPFTSFGNGALSFLYPPRRDGSFPKEPDFTVTPSLRLEVHREAFDDYEYAWLLDQAMQKAREAGRDVSAAEAIFADIERFFHNSNLWSQNDAWFLDLRERMARAIVDLQ